MSIDSHEKNDGTNPIVHDHKSHEQFSIHGELIMI